MSVISFHDSQCQKMQTELLPRIHAVAVTINTWHAKLTIIIQKEVRPTDKQILMTETLPQLFRRTQEELAALTDYALQNFMQALTWDLASVGQPLKQGCDRMNLADLAQMSTKLQALYTRLTKEFEPLDAARLHKQHALLTATVQRLKTELYDTKYRLDGRCPDDPWWGEKAG